MGLFNRKRTWIIEHLKSEVRGKTYNKHISPPKSNEKKPDVTNISHTPPPQSSSIKMKSGIGVWSGIGINMGIIIGSGIFVTPSNVLIQAGSIGSALLVWSLCGIFTLFGALSYMELGIMIPQSGGEYAYLKTAFGNMPAFLYVWMSLLVINTTGKAANSLAFSRYMMEPFLDGPIPAMAIKLVAISLMALLVFINCLKVRWVTRIQNVFTACKLSALVVIILVGWYKLIFDGKYKMFSPEVAFVGSHLNAGFLALAAYQSLYAYAGWTSLNQIMEEMKEPKKNYPRSLFISLIGVTLIYIATNIAYMAVLTPSEMMQTKIVARTFIDKSLGRISSYAMSIFVALSIFGNLNGSLFVGSRIFFASARDGNFPFIFSIINIKYLTPIASLIFIGVITVFYAILYNIITLINFHSFVDALFNLLTVIALMKLKCSNGGNPKQNKIKIHEFIIPVIFGLVCLFLLIVPIATEPNNASLGMAAVCLGIPIFYGAKYISTYEWFQTKNNKISIATQKLLWAVPEEREDIFMEQ